MHTPKPFVPSLFPHDSTQIYRKVTPNAHQRHGGSLPSHLVRREPRPRARLAVALVGRGVVETVAVVARGGRHLQGFARNVA